MTTSLVPETAAPPVSVATPMMLSLAIEAHTQVMEQWTGDFAAIAPTVAMGAALNAAGVGAPTLTIDQARELAQTVVFAGDPAVALIDGLRGLGIQVSAGD